MDLTITTETAVDDNRHWLGVKFGTDTMRPITLAGALFTGTWADGHIPSGVTLAQVTDVGATQTMYGPYDNAATDGRTLMAGHLGTGQSVIKGGGTHNVGAALLWQGLVIVANLPASHGLDANGRADVVNHIKYIG